jgi:outer membrane protein
MKRYLILILLATASLSLTAQTVSLDLKAYLKLVEEHSLDLAAARTDRKLAETQETLARSAVYPMIGGEAGYVRNLTELTQDFGGTEIPLNSENEFSFGLSVQQAIFDIKAFKGLEASRGYLELTGSIYESTRQGVLTFAKKLFYQTLLLEKVLEVRRSSEQIAYENFQETSAKFENGIASRMDLLRAEVNWKVTIPETSKASRNVDVASLNLKSMAGIDSGTAITLEGSLEEYPALPPENSLERILTARPDFQSLQQQRLLGKINLDAKKAEFYPRLSANFTYGWQAASDEFDLSDPTEIISAGLTLSIPVFYGGSRFAQLAQAQLEIEQTANSIDKKRDEIRTEIDNIRLSLKEAGDRIESASQTYTTAEQAYSITRTSVESGLATQLELKDARLSLEGAQLQYYSAIFDYLNAYFDWQSAVGEGDKLPG